MKNVTITNCVHLTNCVQTGFFEIANKTFTEIDVRLAYNKNDAIIRLCRFVGTTLNKHQFSFN